MLGYKPRRRKFGNGVRVTFPRVALHFLAYVSGKVTLTRFYPLRGAALTVSFDSCVIVGLSQLPVTL